MIRRLVPVLAALLSGGVIAAVLVAPSHGGPTLAPAAAQTAAPTGQPAAPKPGSAPSPAADASGSDAVVARVGSSVITAGELEQRIAETPRATLAKLGSTPEEIKRGVLEQVLIRDAILAEEAKAQGLDKKKDVRDRVLAVYRSALIESIKADNGQISDADVKAYYEANQKKFSAPKRIGIHRILVATEDEAKEILADLGTGAPDPKKWNEVAREKSLDKSTHLRGGNLGILNEDGSTTQHDQHYDPALFAAADKVKDGELVPQPVKEGGKFAIVWKRQSMRAMSRPLELEAPGIRAALVDQRIREAVGTLLQGLRPAHLKELNPELTDMVSVNSQGDVEKAKRPGVLPRSKRAANPIPLEGPGGLR